MRVRHPVQGGGRHPLLRPARDQGRDGLPEGRGEPGRRGERQARAQRAQARRRRRQRRQARRVRARRGHPFVEAMRRGARGRRHRPAARGVDRVRAAARRPRRWPPPTRRRPGRPARRPRSTSSGYLAELEAEDSVEADGRLENLGELVGSAREFTALDEFLEQVALGGRHRRDRRRRPGRADDPAHRQGPRVPGGVPARHGGGRVPPQPGAHRARPRWRRSAGSPTWASPAPRSKLHLSHAWSRQLFGTTQYNPPSRFLDEIPADLVEQKGTSVAAAATAARATATAIASAATATRRAYKRPRGSRSRQRLRSRRRRRLAPRAGGRGGAQRRSPQPPAPCELARSWA